MTTREDIERGYIGSSAMPEGEPLIDKRLGSVFEAEGTQQQAQSPKSIQQGDMQAVAADRGSTISWVDQRVEEKAGPKLQQG